MTLTPKDQVTLNSDNELPFDLSQYAYTNSLSRVENAATKGTLDEIDGYLEVKHCPVLGFDLLECKFVAGADDIIQLETQLVEAFGEDYSLRYTILELA